ncbi:MAG TPA: peptidoglycan recognition protein family protein [Candidatus Hypogeohydataceae bacterium YC40]
MRRLCILVFFVFLIGGCAETPKEIVSVPPPAKGPLVAEPQKKEEPPAVLNIPRVPITRKWSYIVIHHSASYAGNANAFDYIHRVKRGWEGGLGYHFVIGNGHGSGDGQIEVGHRWLCQYHGAHAGVAEYNQHGIGICLVGNFQEDSPTPKQLASLVALIRELQQLCGIPSENVILHRHVRNTECPGRNFPYYEVLAKLLR